MNSYFIDVGAVSAVIDVQQLFSFFFFWPKKCSGHGRYGRYASYATVLRHDQQGGSLSSTQCSRVELKSKGCVEDVLVYFLQLVTITAGGIVE